MNSPIASECIYYTCTPMRGNLAGRQKSPDLQHVIAVAYARTHE